MFTLTLVADHPLDEHALALEAELLRLQQVQLHLQLLGRHLHLYLAPLRQRQARCGPLRLPTACCSTNIDLTNYAANMGLHFKLI